MGKHERRQLLQTAYRDGLFLNSDKMSIEELGMGLAYSVFVSTENHRELS